MAERDWTMIVEPDGDGTPYVRRCKIPFGWLYQLGQDKWPLNDRTGDEATWVEWGQAVFVPEGTTEN